MIVNYLEQEVIIPRKNCKTRYIYLAGPTRWNVHLESWRKKAFEIIKSLEFDGVVYCPEYSKEKFEKDYREKAEWKEEALKAATTIVFWVPKNYPISCSTNGEFAYWIAKKPRNFFYGREESNSNYEQVNYLDWLYEEKMHCKPYDNFEDLILDAVIHASEKRIFGKTQREILQTIYRYRDVLPPNGCSCPECMASWKRQLKGKFVSTLKSFAEAEEEKLKESK